VVTHDIAGQAFAAGTERPDRRPGWASTPCSWLRPAWGWSSWLRWASAPTSMRPDNRKRPKGKLLTLMRRLTVCISRARKDALDRYDGKHAPNVKDRPDSARRAACGVGRLGLWFELERQQTGNVCANILLHKCILFDRELDNQIFCCG
jgi:hypothetical protein